MKEANDKLDPKSPKVNEDKSFMVFYSCNEDKSQNPNIIAEMKEANDKLDPKSPKVNEDKSFEETCTDLEKLF